MHISQEGVESHKVTATCRDNLKSNVLWCEEPLKIKTKVKC